MKVYYSVVTKVYDNGRVECNLDGCKSFEERPENTCVGLAGYDLYMDFFETEKEAKEFVQEAWTA